MKKLFIILSVLMLTFSACKNTKNITSTEAIAKINANKLNTLIDKNEFSYKYFTTKARVNFDNQTFTANFRMLKDSMIWISFTGPFNIEGARVKITPTRFEMINKLNGSYYDMPFSFIENYIPINANFELLEDLIVGNLLEKEIKKQKIETNANTYIVKGDIKNLETTYVVLKNGKPQNIDAQNISGDKLVNIVFEKYDKVDNQEFALKRKFLIKDGEKNYLLDLKFYKFEFEETDFPFSVPAGYTKYN